MPSVCGGTPNRSPPPTHRGASPTPHLLGRTVQGLGAADVEAEQDSVRVAVAKGTHVVIVGRAWEKRGCHCTAHPPPSPRDSGPWSGGACKETQPPFRLEWGAQSSRAPPKCHLRSPQPVNIAIAPNEAAGNGSRGVYITAAPAMLGSPTSGQGCQGAAGTQWGGGGGGAATLTGSLGSQGHQHCTGDCGERWCMEVRV